MADATLPIHLRRGEIKHHGHEEKSAPSWSDAKAKLSAFDRAGLLGLLQDLYATGKDNQAFVHARLQLGDDVLKPYKAAIERWLWPDVFKNQDTSVAKAKKAVADYKKACGSAEGLADLMVFYCERASGFACDVGMDDETYLGALARMFEQAMQAVTALPADQQAAWWNGWLSCGVAARTSAMAWGTASPTCLPNTGGHDRARRHPGAANQERAAGGLAGSARHGVASIARRHAAPHPGCTVANRHAAVSATRPVHDRQGGALSATLQGPH